MGVIRRNRYGISYLDTASRNPKRSYTGGGYSIMCIDILWLINSCM